MRAVHGVSSVSMDATLCTIDWLKRKRFMISSVGKEVGELKISCISSGTTAWFSNFKKQFGAFIKLHKHHITQQFSTPPPPGIHSREMKTHVHKTTYKQTIMAAVLET